VKTNLLHPTRWREMSNKSHSSTRSLLHTPEKTPLGGPHEYQALVAPYATKKTAAPST
jgi:hypothetical protein